MKLGLTAAAFGATRPLPGFDEYASRWLTACFEPAVRTGIGLRAQRFCRWLDEVAAALRSHLVCEGKITDSDRGIMRAYERIGRKRGREDLLFEQSVADDWARFKENEKREDAKWKAKQGRSSTRKSKVKPKRKSKARK